MSRTRRAKNDNTQPIDYGRRRLVLAAASFTAVDLALETQGIGLFTSGYKLFEGFRKKLNYIPAPKLAGMLELHGIPSQIYDVQSDRTFLALAERHGENIKQDSAQVRVYNQFFNTLTEIHAIDALFMEGVYDQNIEPDPYYAACKDSAKVFGAGPDDPYQFNKNYDNDSHQSNKNHDILDHLRRDDPHGYYSYSQKYLTYGLEDQNLFIDTLFLEAAWKYKDNLIKRFQSHPEEREAFVKELIDFEDNKIPQLNTILQVVKVAEYDSNGNKYLAPQLFEELTKTLDDAMITKRNSHFSGIIDSKLRSYELGTGILGKTHVFGDQRTADLTDKRTIVKLLNDTGINVITVTLDDLENKYN